MWTDEQSIETAASPDAIWRLWSDVARWPEWNADIEHIEFRDPSRLAARSR
jgi:Polyketide cyclase / dehydrase and lipid transport